MTPSDPKLSLAAPAIHQPVPAIINALKHVLRLAEKGEIISLGVAYEFHDHDLGFRSAFGPYSYPGLLISELETMKLAIVTNRLLPQVEPYDGTEDEDDDDDDPEEGA